MDILNVLRRKGLVIIACIVGVISFVIGLSVGLWYFQEVEAPSNTEQCKAMEVSPNPDQEFDLIMEDLTPGDRDIYERKMTMEVELSKGNRWGLGWGDAAIPVFGCINSIPVNTAQLENRVVTIQANQNDLTIFEKSVKTDRFGNFGTTFFAPESGIILVSAEIANLNSTIAEETISVVVTEAWAPIIIVLILIVISIAIIVGFMRGYGRDKIPNWSIIPVVIPVILAYAFLYKFPPFDEAANTAFATALIVPIATYIYQILTKSNPKAERNKASCTHKSRMNF
jgi:hypothetical protein